MQRKSLGASELKLVLLAAHRLRSVGRSPRRLALRTPPALTPRRCPARYWPLVRSPHPQRQGFS